MQDYAHHFTRYEAMVNALNSFIDITEIQQYQHHPDVFSHYMYNSVSFKTKLILTFVDIAVRVLC